MRMEPDNGAQVLSDALPLAKDPSQGMRMMGMVGSERKTLVDGLDLLAGRMEPAACVAGIVAGFGKRDGCLCPVVLGNSPVGGGGPDGTVKCARGLHKRYRKPLPARRSPETRQSLLKTLASVADRLEPIEAGRI